MTIDPVTQTIDWRDPPRDLSLPLQALWWIKKGQFRVGPEWDKAHDICVQGEGHQPMDWVHALLHWVEADMSGADYWYRQAGMRRKKPSVAEEWSYMVEQLAGDTNGA